jgi:hypothetical protein
VIKTVKPQRRVVAKVCYEGKAKEGIKDALGVDLLHHEGVFFHQRVEADRFLHNSTTAAILEERSQVNPLSIPKLALFLEKS